VWNLLNGVINKNKFGKIMEIILLLISVVSIIILTFYLLSTLSTIENNRFIEELMKEDEKKNLVK
jgi:hypothetical protein